MSRDHENRGQYFEEVQQDGAIIRNISERWENARCELNKKVEKERCEIRQWVGAITVAIAGVIITAIIALWRC